MYAFIFATQSKMHLIKVRFYIMMYLPMKLEYNKKGIPNFDELGTIPKF